MKNLLIAIILLQTTVIINTPEEEVAVENIVACKDCR